MADQIIYPQHRVEDDDGNPVAGGKVNVYATGTLTRVDTYSDSAATTIQTNPIIADGNGYFGQMFTSVDGVRLVVTDADDVTIRDIDPAPVTLAVNQGAGSISFSPTEDVPYGTVQEAIEGVSADQQALLQAVGWNIAGTDDDEDTPATSVILADLDAITLASGAFRFGDETSGTFPTGVAANDKGTVLVLRGRSGSATMQIWLAGKDLGYHRRLVDDVWGTWSEIALIEGPWAVGDIAYRQAGGWKSRPLASPGDVLVVNSDDTAPAWAGSALEGETITSGATYTFTHNLGRKARAVTFELVCLTAEHGYAIGNIVEVLPIGCSVRKHTTTVVVRLSNDATVFSGAHLTTGAPVDFTNANWSMTMTTF